MDLEQKKTIHTFFSTDGTDNRFMVRLLSNILLRPALEQELAVSHDPDMEFLHSRDGFGIIICAVSRRQDTPQSLLQLIRQQETAFTIISEALQSNASDFYCCYTSEIENQLVTLILRKDEAPLVSTDCAVFLQELLGETATNLAQKHNIPLRLVWGTQEKFLRLHQTYTMLKNAVIYFDFMEQPFGGFTQISAMVPRQHIDLWTTMEESNVAFVDAFLQNDVSRAVDRVKDTIRAIDGWIAPSKDVFLGDVQYYFDSIINRLSIQFGQEVLEGIPDSAVIFDSTCISKLLEHLTDIVHNLFLNVRRNTSNETFSRLLDVRAYINQNIRDYALTVGRAADHFSISPQLLSIQFKKCFGITPIQYIERQRVALIKDYLLHTNLSIEKICEQVGIGTVSTLHRIFQKNVGQSPGAYRRSMQSLPPI